MATVYSLTQSASNLIENNPWSPAGPGLGLRGKKGSGSHELFLSYLVWCPAVISQESSKQFRLFRALKTQNPLQPLEKRNHNTPKMRLKAATGHR